MQQLSQKIYDQLVTPTPTIEYYFLVNWKPVPNNTIKIRRTK